MTVPGNTEVVLAAGGTGGHLFPAAALAREWLARGGRVRVATDRRGSPQARRIPGVCVSTVRSAGLAGVRIADRLLALVLLVAGTMEALLLLLRRRPAVVVGFGSYASVPVAAAARVLGIPLVLHESNAVPGRANRFLARHATAVGIAFEAASAGLFRARCCSVGMPVREGFESASPYDPPATGETFRIVVTGGSQGAQALGVLVPEALGRLSGEERSRIEIFLQARPEDLERVRETLEGLGVRAEVVDFIRDMPEALDRAHLAVGRSGAATVAENAASQRPAIYVPLPSSIDGHQLANARAVVARGAGWIVEEGDEAALELSRLLGDLLKSPERLLAASRKASGLNPPGAARRLADLVAEVAGERSR